MRYNFTHDAYYRPPVLSLPSQPSPSPAVLQPAQAPHCFSPARRHTHHSPSAQDADDAPIVCDLVGRPIAADADLYPNPQSYADAAPVAARGDLALLYAAIYLQETRVRTLVTQRAVDPNARFFPSSDSVLGMLCSGVLPTGFAYHAGGVFRKKFTRIIAFLATCGAVDIRSHNRDGETPLLRAARNGLVEPFVILLNAGAAGEHHQLTVADRDMLWQMVDAARISDTQKETMWNAIRKTWGAKTRCEAVQDQPPAKRHR